MNVHHNLNNKAAQFVVLMSLLTVAACNGSEDPPPGEPIPPVVNPTNPPSASTCGASAVSLTQPGTAIEQHAEFSLNDIVGGTIDPDDISQSSHFWSVTLAPGSYDLILESARTDREIGDMGLVLSTTVPGGDVTGIPINTQRIDRRIREHRTVDLSSTSGNVNILFEINGNFGAERYRMALIAKPLTIPSPFFDECPNVVRLSSGTTQALSLGAGNSASDEQWYYIEERVGKYDLALNSAAPITPNDNVNFGFLFLGPYGNVQAALAGVGDSGVITQTAPIANYLIDLELSSSVSDTYAAYFRLRNSADPVSMELSLTEATNGQVKDSFDSLAHRLGDSPHRLNPKLLTSTVINAPGISVIYH